MSDLFLSSRPFLRLICCIGFYGALVTASVINMAQENFDRITVESFGTLDDGKAVQLFRLKNR